MFPIKTCLLVLLQPVHPSFGAHGPNGRPVLRLVDLTVKEQGKGNVLGMAGVQGAQANQRRRRAAPAFVHRV